ncbi:MAG: hypothetical protein PHU86_01870 [Patescibacteria group bacterium]|nr:hypothetical protein [Patescibacteria group bacterium]
MGQEITGFGPDDDKVFGPDGKEYRIKRLESDNPPKDETVEYKGKKYRRVLIPNYTLRTYYSHETEDVGPGPGWDFKGVLLDDDLMMQLYGRTFTPNEAFDPSALPDIPVYRIEDME